MSNILIKTVRINGFRGLKNIEVELEKTTVLTGMNNAGKTSFLKALQIVFGNRHFITQDDFFIENGNSVEKIIIDVLIVPMEADNFSEEWEILFTHDRIKDDGEKSYIPLRTIITFDPIRTTYITKQYILESWSSFDDWYNSDNGNENSKRFEEMPFFYMDAQRDILDDLKSKSSYLGKMLSKIEYSPDALLAIEEQIKALNETAVSDSPILKDIRETLKNLDSTIGSHNENIEITPFTKKVRDLNKGLTIYYGNEQDSFPMEHHGMGTRSWSSLLTLKAFIELLESKAIDNPFFPILAVEEPESHLHPNAQKKLYSQINSMSGQKIISTHSPYIAGASKISEIRSFYKDEVVKCGKINIEILNSESIRKIERQVINSRGEIFFSKCLVLFEGETEEQALPMLFEKYFDTTPIELGVDFIGVGGFGNYLPFIRFAEDLQIPWIIFSDGEVKVIKSLKKSIKQLYNIDTVDLSDYSNIFILEEESDFEKYLIKNGFSEEIELSFNELYSDEYLTNEFQNRNGTIKGRTKTQNICEECNQNIYEDNIRNYIGEDGYKEFLYDCMMSQKTKFAPIIANQIVISEKPLPPKIISLFEKINTILNINEVTA